MKTAATDKKFEKAARLRDALRFIEDLEARQSISDTSGQDIDVFGLAVRGGKWQAVILRQRDGKLVQELSFALKGDADGPADAMGQLLPQFYRETTDIPSLILVRDEPVERTILEEWLTTLKGTKVQVLMPERGRKSALLEMAEKNADEKVQQQFAAWEAEARKVEDALTGLTKIVKLSATPKRIEGYDISHLGGTATVGSMVVFENGKPKREHYRSFNITSIKDGEIDDYRSLAEVLRRRLQYLRAGVQDQRATWKSRGINIGRAKKNEQLLLEEIISRYPGTLGPERIEYQDFLVARNTGGEIVALASLHEDRAKLLEIDPVWVSDSHRGSKLGLLMVQLLLQNQKKKVYVLCKPNLEEYYANIGFRRVREMPEYLQRKVKEFAEEFHQPEEIVMMIEPKKTKPDPSFTAHPDLLLIDGGKGQLSTVVSVLAELGLSIPVAGLAKREEEIFLPENSLPERVPKDSEARFLLQRVRDEAHRFANSKREKRLAAVLTKSAVDDMSGIGDVTKAKLVQKFGSLAKAKNANEEELKEVLTERQMQEYWKHER
jgi:excinuclease UvrABC nuclease subunit